jgi:hypothetical protein
MANQFYTILPMPFLEKNGERYELTDYTLSLEEFLTENSGKDIYIFEESLATSTIRAVVLEN